MTAMNPHRRSALASPGPLVLSLLLLGDAQYIAMHIAFLGDDGVSNPMYSLKTDRGLAEFYQYLKFVWAAALLGLLAVSQRSLTALAWAGMMLFLAADDALGLHERFGGVLAAWLALPAIGGMEPPGLGEVVFAGVVTGVLALLIAVAWWRDAPCWRGLSVRLALAYGLLGFFAMGVDTLDEVFPALDGPWFDMIEDSGEMVAVSLMVWVSFGYATGARAQYPAAWPSLRDSDAP